MNDLISILRSHNQDIRFDQMPLPGADLASFMRAQIAKITPVRSITTKRIRVQRRVLAIVPKEV